jgi:hypothetical protein
VLTHEAAREGWQGAAVIATYRVAAPEVDPSAQADLAQARHIYWSSGSQFDQYGTAASQGAQHYCGPGKTLAHLRKNGVEPKVFPSAEEWRKWLKT